MPIAKISRADGLNNYQHRGRVAGLVGKNTTLSSQSFDVVLLLLIYKDESKT